ncbi:MAG: hypothetical protein C4306_09190 [Thermoleophilia bacterium]
MSGRLALFTLLVLVVAAPAGADSIADRKQAVDSRIAALRERVDRMREQEEAVRAEIEAIASRIRALEAQAGDVSTRLVLLEEELALRTRKIGRLSALLALQRDRLKLARREYAVAVDRLNERLVGLYETEEADAVSLLLSTASFSELLDAVDYLRAIGDQDKRVAQEVAERRRQARLALLETRAARERVRQEARVIAIRVEQTRALRQQLLVARDAVASQKERRERALATLTQSERAELAEIEALQRASAELAARIRAAQAVARTTPAPSAPSAAGFVWPVSGPVTSPYGMRWGRMHEGIDIAAPMGAPVRAAAAGQVIYAGWMGGYGNLVVIDHGGGLATAYAHLSSISVSLGQAVGQGDLVGAVGSTGHSFGPHLHFEVRVNGVAVDPLGYL